MNKTKTSEDLVIDSMVKAERLKKALNYLDNLANDDISIPAEELSLNVLDAVKMLVPMMFDQAYELHELLSQANELAEVADNMPLMAAVTNN